MGQVGNVSATPVLLSKSGGYTLSGVGIHKISSVDKVVSSAILALQTFIQTQKIKGQRPVQVPKRFIASDPDPEPLATPKGKKRRYGGEVMATSMDDESYASGGEGDSSEEESEETEEPKEDADRLHKVFQDSHVQ